MPTRDDICADFLGALAFSPYPVQEEALLAWFSTDSGIMVCCPTGMGKTLIAEAAIYEALRTRKRIYYTTPLIALTEQKFREFGEKAQRWGFSRDDVGLITGNRRQNPDALVRVVVAEILLNHLLGAGGEAFDAPHTAAVVMDEFHSFNDAQRGIVWELSLTLLPPHVRVMLLSATVGNPYDFADWLRAKHGRKLDVVLSNERRVPLDFVWVEDKLLTEHLPDMVSRDDAENRTPALVFCFNRDECWDVAEKLKGLPIVTNEAKKRIEAVLATREDELREGVGPKLRQMLLRGVGVHHAGVLPRHKILVEELFEQKLAPFVVCTETLAAGINLPARSVVFSTLLKGKRGDKKLVPASTAHQMFGRAGRPQFDTRGYVYVVAHDDDVKINKWRKRYEQIDPNSKDPGILRARKELERKRPTRRKNEQYWSEGQLKSLIEAGPAKLFSRSMIPYSVLIYLLARTGELREIREFLSRRFNTQEFIEKFLRQLEFMIDNLAALGYLTRAEDGNHVTPAEHITRLQAFRSVDPLYGDFLVKRLGPAGLDEKILALESILEVPRVIERKVRIPYDLPKGPLQTNELEPLMIAMGVALGPAPGSEDDEDEYEEIDPWATPEEAERRPPTFPEMLKIDFDARLAGPEEIFIQPKWIAGGAFREECEFFRFVKSCGLIKQEGLVLRHLLRLVILANEFFELSEDPDYQRISELSTRTCQRVDPDYTDRFLADAEAARKLVPA